MIRSLLCNSHTSIVRKAAPLLAAVSFGYVPVALHAKPQHNNSQGQFKNPSNNMRAASQNEAANWVRSMLAAERSAQFTANEVISHPDREAVKARVWRKNNQRRMEFVAPPVRKGDVLVENGQTVWLYHRAENVAIQTKSLRSRLSNGTVTINGNFNVRVGQPSQVDGRPAAVVEYVRRDNGQVVRRLWIDRETRLLLGTQSLRNGRETERVTWNDIDSGSVPASQFRWRPPQGAQIVRTGGAAYSQLQQARNAAPWLQFPHYVPAGFIFESAIVDSKKGEAWLRYASATQRFSLFQQRAAGVAQNAPANPQKVSGGWYWQNNGMRLLLAGAPTDVASRLISSIR